MFVALLSMATGLVAALMYLAAAMTAVAFVVYLRKGGYVFTQGLPLLAGRGSTTNATTIPGDADQPTRSV